MQIVVVGAGAVGSRVARQVASVEKPTRLIVVDRDRSRAAMVAKSLGPPAMAATWSSHLLEEADVLVLGVPGEHQWLAEDALRHGVDVVSTGDGEDQVRGLLALDAEASSRGRHVVVGAAFSPGLSCLLARHAASLVDEVDEIRIARTGTGGPSCLAGQGRLLRGKSLDRRGGERISARAGTGRELCWFPEPVGARDCYRGPLVEPLLLTTAFPAASRVSARMAVTRRDRLTGWLPVPRFRAPATTIGGIRVEVRGHRGRGREAVVLGAIEHPDVAAGTVAAVAVAWARAGRLCRTGAGGLAELVANPVPFLHELARRGVRAATFDPGHQAWPDTGDPGGRHREPAAG